MMQGSTAHKRKLEGQKGRRDKSDREAGSREGERNEQMDASSGSSASVCDGVSRLTLGFLWFAAYRASPGSSKLMRLCYCGTRSTSRQSMGARGTRRHLNFSSW